RSWPTTAVLADTQGVCPWKVSAIRAGPVSFLSNPLASAAVSLTTGPAKATRGDIYDARFVPTVTGTATIVFTDLAGSTALRSLLGERPADAFRCEHDVALVRAVNEHRGRVVRARATGSWPRSTPPRTPSSPPKPCSGRWTAMACGSGPRRGGSRQDALVL